jgi:NTF2 fold immunity protein
MRVTLALLLVLFMFTTAVSGEKEHKDYVPDQKTAVRVAEAILVAQYGEERVNAQLPLLADGSNKDFWIVQGSAHAAVPSFGGGPAVWINKHSGCILGVVEHMK